MRGKSRYLGAACPCQPGGLSFEHMFESAINPKTPGSVPGVVGAGPAPGARVIAPQGEPLEFMYKGRRFHVHAIVSRWRESGGWWNRIDDGRLQKAPLEDVVFDDGGKAIWRVEAAPEGALATFEIELDEITGKWQVRPTSRPS